MLDKEPSLFFGYRVRSFSVGETVRRKSGGRWMKFGGVIENTRMAYLSWTSGYCAYADLIKEDELEAVSTAPKSIDVAEHGGLGHPGL